MASFKFLLQSAGILPAGHVWRAASRREWEKMGEAGIARDGGLKQCEIKSSFKFPIKV
jgi:hypothetical protein